MTLSDAFNSLSDYFLRSDIHMTPNFLLLLPLLLHPPGVPGEAVQHSLECSDDKPTTLCLAKSYSTFDLPLRQKENMVEIGNICTTQGWGGSHSLH